MIQRPALGRGLFYTRDSEGHSELAPPQYVGWAQKEAAKLGVAFNGTPDAISSMIARGVSAEGDLFVDYGVSGNHLSRTGFDAFQRRALSDKSVTHLFVPRRDRIARPDDPLDALLIERSLLAAGLTLVLMDRVLGPQPRGQRPQLADTIMGVIEYDSSGRFRRDLAEKLIYAKIKLAEGGYSIGGEPVYGFRRWLVGPDGSGGRELVTGEVVKRSGHHVMWLPTAKGELEVVRRILDLIETTPASRIAAMLNREAIPSPKAGRARRVRGVERKLSGLWTQNTVRNIATHPLLIAVNEYGRRASGDQLRMTPGGPRALSDADFRPDGRLKVVEAAEGETIRVSATFEPLIPVERRANIRQVLDDRGRHLKGRPRARDGVANPLGGRVFDMNCGWSMYRHARRGSWGYQCGLYQNSEAAACSHNVVPGEAVTRFVLSCVRQRVLMPAAKAKLVARLEQFAAAEVGEDRSRSQRVALEAEVAAVERKIETVGRNMALAETAEQHKVTAAVFEELKEESSRLRARLDGLRPSPVSADPGREVELALDGLDRLHELANETGAGPAAAGELIRRIDARLYLNFRAVERGRRTINVPSGGVLTFGSTPPPGPLYDGPTDRAIIRRMLAAGESVTASPGGVPSGETESGPEANWSANVQRGTSHCSGPATPYAEFHR
jgi:hypothetical protein